MLPRKERNKEIFAIVWKVVLIQLTVELGIMTYFHYFPNDSLWEAVIDPVILCLISVPLISYFIVSPFIRERDHLELSSRKLQLEKQKELQQQAKDLTETVEKTALELKLSEERYALAAKGSNDGLWDWDLRNNTIFYSNRFIEIFGGTTEWNWKTPNPWLERIHQEDISRFMGLLEKSKESPEAEEHFECEYRIRNEYGEYIWCLSRWLCVFSEGKPARIVGSQTDITQRKNMEAKLLYDAFHDSLTGIPNRILLTDRLDQAILRLQRNRSEKFAFLFIDLDNFKRINDSLGHLAGDELLKTIATRLRFLLRSMDTIARMGGDEFAIILQSIKKPQELEEIVSKLVQVCEEPIILNDQEVIPSASIGVVMVSSSKMYQTSEEIIRDGDLALYRAKNDGRGRYTIFDVEMRKAMDQQFEITNNLQGALERGELNMFYQPIIDINTLQVAGFESLMRWHHPRHGIVLPGCFIPLAEESKMIVKLGEFALYESIKRLKTWQEEYPWAKDWYMSINVSGKQLLGTDLPLLLGKILGEVQMDPKHIKIEVTENVLIAGSDHAKWVLGEIKRLGFSLALDDFGIGYSSLSTLKDYPFDTLKIDRSFNVGLHDHAKDHATIQAISQIGKTLRLRTIMEGIETMEQLNFVKDLGIHYAQGYLFGKPMEAAVIDDFLIEHHRKYKA